jgi:hypothetical protein
MKISLSSMIYPVRCVDETVPAFADFCSVIIGPEQNQSYSIEILPLSPASDDELVANEFLNYLLSVSISNHLLDRRD